MQSIISKGKDVHEAIRFGLKLLESSKNDVDIEIIQQESKGFLGIGAKAAVVKITKNPTTEGHSKQDSLEQIVDLLTEEPLNKASLNQHEAVHRFINLDSQKLAGKVWIKEGQIHCQSSPTHFPTVTSKAGVEIYKDNQLVKESTTIVTEKDTYVLKVKNEEKPTTWKVYFDEHYLKVFLDVVPGYKTVRTIPNITPDYHIDIVVEEQKEMINTLDYVTIMQKLESLRVKHGFNQDEIMKAIEATEPLTFEIATGISPKPGKDGWIELKVETKTQNGLKEKEDGRVDFREIKTIPNVERGQIIAVVHPPIPGKMGYTVMNEPLPAKQTFPIILKLGQGVLTVDDKVVATESGRPHIEQRGQLVKVSILPKLTHQGNVDLSTGNIRFMGDVEVLGEVQERMTIDAEGDIYVHNTVMSSTLVASGAVVTYGNIISSEVSAGKNNMLVAELGHLLGILHQNLEKMVAVIKELTGSQAFKSNDFSRSGLQPLVRILLEKRFKSFPPLAKKYVDVVKKGEDYLLDDVWREVSVSLTQLFLSLTNEVTSLERIMQLSQKMNELHELSNSPVEPDSFITIPNVLNSKLYCSGNILVLGQGCVNSKIHAGGQLKINGIVRGGEVYGRLGVEINQVGSESGTSTVVAVPADQTITIKKAMDGTILKFGSIKHTLNEDTDHLVASLDEHDRVVFN